jgi:hypothetical protein
MDKDTSSGTDCEGVVSRKSHDQWNILRLNPANAGAKAVTDDSLQIWSIQVFEPVSG